VNIPSFKALSIKGKLIVTIMGISTLTLLTSLSIFMSSELVTLKKNMREDLSALANLVGKNSEGALMFLDNHAAGDNLLALKAKTHIHSAYLFNAKGQLFAYYSISPNSVAGTKLPQAVNLIDNKQMEVYFYKADHIHLIRRILFEQDKSLLGFIYIESDRELYWGRVSEYLYTIIIMVGFSLLLSLILAFRAQKIFTSPIFELLHSMQFVSTSQDYSLTLKNEHNDEFGELISGYNNMLGELDQQNQLTKNYQQELEKRVAERTRQLKKARDEALSASRTKSIFLANMSHEIRTPMNAILGYAQLLQQSQLDKEQIRKLKIIDDSGNHLLSLINNILELSKIEVGMLELCHSDFDLRELVRNIENMFKIRCDQKNIAWQVEFFSEQPVLVHGDQGKLRQILINLVGNACKFTDYGKVIFQVKQIANDRYQFIVKDTGMGIEEDALLRIFDAFHQEKQGELKGGTGLGLNITRRYIELLSGELYVESRLNQGSSFSFDIELPQAQQLSLQTLSEPSNSLFILPENSHLSALVVDDIKDNTDLLSNILKDMGFSIRVAENGRDALDEISRICPDIVFMDIRMPVMDGVDAIVQLRKNYPSEQLKCVAVSATGLKHNAQYYLDKGFDQFISKPFRFEVIYHAIANLLGVQLQAVDNKHGLEHQDKTIHHPAHKHEPHYDRQWLKKIIHAAEYGQLTELRALILAFNDYGEAGQIVANHLDLLITKADLDGIIDYMEVIIND